MTTEVLTDSEAMVAEWVLLPSSGGVFEVTVNGTLVFSKKSLGRHGEPGEVAGLVKKALLASWAAP